MGLLGDNIANYKNASLLTHAEKIRNKKYMLMHGTYDDNVHYQQSMMLSYELERRVILFRQQVIIFKNKTKIIILSVVNKIKNNLIRYKKYAQYISYVLLRIWMCIKYFLHTDIWNEARQIIIYMNLKSHTKYESKIFHFLGFKYKNML